MEENQKGEIMTNETQMICSLEDYSIGKTSEQKLYTTIKDPKTIFNLESNCDYRLNDCIDEKIRVKDMLCKVIKTKLEEPEILETGEVKEYKFSMITILIDEEGKSYVTASKAFFFSFMKYCQMFPDAIKNGETEIKIIKVTTKNSNNKSLGFELL